MLSTSGGGGLAITGITEAASSSPGLVLRGVRDGSTSNPAMAFVASEHSGTSVAGNLESTELAFQFHNQNSTLMTIDGAGNVGIGTTNPTSDFHVVTDATTTNGVTFDASTVTTGTAFNVEVDGNNMQSNGFAFTITRDSSKMLSVGEWGDLGFGATNYGYFEYVGGSTQFQMNSRDHIRLDIDYDNTTTDRALLITKHSGAVELMRVQEDGNVGIGTASPTAKLDVYNSTTTSTTTSDLNSLGAAGTGNITVASTTGFPISGILYVEYEAMSFTVVDGTTINITARGVLGTTGATHANGLSLAFIEQMVSKGSSNPAMVTTSDARLGVGTAAPLGSLSLYNKNVGGNSHAMAWHQVVGATGGDPYTVYYIPGGTYWSIGADNSNSDSFRISNASTLHDSQQQFTITTAGNVGIGTATPGYKLDVAGPARFQGNNHAIILSDTGGGTYGYVSIAGAGVTGAGIKSGSNAFLLGSSDSGIVVNSSGNVGIGTASPSYPLVVNGDMSIAANSTLRFGALRFAHGSNTISTVFSGSTSFDITDNIFTNVLVRVQNNGNVGIRTTTPGHD